VIRQQEGDTAGLARYTWKDTTYGVYSFDVDLPFCMHAFQAVWTPPTCTEDGYYTYTCELCGVVEQEVFPNTALGHDWNAATCTEPATCRTCGATSGEALGHTAKILPGKEPNCTEPGLTEGQTCTSCGLVLVAQEEISPIGHNYVDGKCERCGQQDDLLGDLDGNGRVNARDVRLLLRYIAGLTEADEVKEIAADFNGDGRINARDARDILRFIAGFD
jgi:hypothetical protein